ncbi:GatB/YqeY domain-containing protein [Coprothermobacter platensis]|uniref:GatB/YqeY domain-containing protein n=1 Tax=Coprothermobacter platensis TaxID=108819 RepID=UPI0003660654|nr:GatB/YqeY domain-containing protein [Coprothermobacter platensis]
MSLKEQLQDELKQYMKARDTLRLEVVRSVLTAVKNIEVQKMKTADDEDVLQAIRQEVKKRREAIELYEKAGRNELAQKEQAELEVLEAYLPKMMSDEEVRNVIKAHIVQMQPKDIKERGKIMGSVMQELKGKAEGALVGKILDEELAAYLNGGQ